MGMSPDFGVISRQDKGICRKGNKGKILRQLSLQELSHPQFIFLGIGVSNHAV
jgi:hypothetical protein